MANTATINRVRTAQRRGAALDGTNFMPKRQRKIVRKSMVRGYLANRAADARIGAENRMKFYRNLRLLKVRRRKIAAEMAVLAEMLGHLVREVRRVGDRYDRLGINETYFDEAVDMTKLAASAAGAAADEFASFSRARVWYSEEVR